MSREWARDSFVADTPAPKGFVPQGFEDKAERVSAADLAARMRAPRTPFRTVDLRGQAVDAGGFVAGAGPVGLRREAEPVAEPESAAPPPPVREAERIVEPVAPAVDPQTIFDAGVAEGQRRASAASSADADACARLLSSLAGAGRFDREGLARRLRQTVLHLVGQLVGEAGISPDRLGSRVDEAVRMLADVTEPARLSLHPDDLAMMHDRLAPNIAAVPDPAMERGGFRLETLSATVEDGPTLWLEQLEAALDRVAAPGE